MKLLTTTEVATEPILAADLKAWLSLDSDSQNTMLTAIAKAARAKVELLTGKAICERVLDYTVEMPNYGILELPYPPIVSISSLKTIDSEGNTTSITTGYAIVNNQLVFSGGIGSVVQVSYKAGIAATELEKQLILKQSAWDYTHRGDSEASNYSPDIMREIQFTTINNGF
jgi:uncharacterized phiE125 gp8 family phage protein